MRYNIKHEGLLFAVVACSCVVVVFLVGSHFLHSMGALYALVALCNIVVWPLYLLNCAIGLTITIDEKTMLIEGMFVRKRIKIADIYDVSIENYITRKQRGFSKDFHRMRMKIRLVPDKLIILDDDASVKQPVNWKIELKTEKKPDEEVALYQVYKQLQSMINKGTVRDLS